MVNAQSAVRNFINNKFTEIRLKNRHYSLRDLAARLKVSPSTLSELISGRRNVSKKLASNFLDTLYATPKERVEIIAAFEEVESVRLADTHNSKSFIQIEMDRYRFISEWYFLPLLSLAETDTFKSDYIWIAARLGISALEAKSAVDLLIRLELLHRTSKGTIKPTGKQFATSDNVSNIYLQKSHFDNLELAKRSLENDEIDQRDFTSMTLSFDPKDIPEAKAMIRAFRNRFCSKLEVDHKKKEVFRICIQLFQLTKPTKE